MGGFDVQDKDKAAKLMDEASSSAAGIAVTNPRTRRVQESGRGAHVGQEQA